MLRFWLLLCFKGTYLSLISVILCNFQLGLAFNSEFLGKNFIIQEYSILRNLEEIKEVKKDFRNRLIEEFNGQP